MGLARYALTGRFLFAGYAGTVSRTGIFAYFQLHLTHGRSHVEPMWWRKDCSQRRHPGKYKG